jgi:hypothetical protein
MSGFASGGGRESAPTIESILTQIAPNDAQHDFGNHKPDTVNEKTAYNKGLYRGSGNTINYGTEAQSLASVVETPTNYTPITSANPNMDFCHTSSHPIETKNGKNYTVKYADVKWMPRAKTAYRTAEFEKVKNEINAKKNADKSTTAKKKAEMNAEIDALKAKEKKGFIENLKEKIDELRGTFKDQNAKAEVERHEIDAPMFYEMMGINVNETIAIVVDAASIGLIEILSHGKFSRGNRPTVYYIYGPEVVHDPATKKHPSSPEFKDPNVWLEGVRWIPCVSLNPSSFVYSYSYIPDDPTGLYLNKFFTNYEFELSELKETSKGKTIEYSTDLTIKALDDKYKIKFIDESIDSKSKSDITFLTKIIEVLKEVLQTGEEKQFQYAISFLKKMSGDWLQVLLTLGIAMRNRGFTPHKGTRENITAKIDRAFFVTHDQIALSFALLMGVECIFTHHGPVEGNPSLHSAFLFSLANEADVNSSIIRKATAVNTNYITQIDSLQVHLAKYNEDCNISLSGPIRELDAYLSTEMPTPFQVDVFDKYVKNIFTTGLRLVATKRVLPDLTASMDSNTKLTSKNTLLQTKIAEFKKKPDDVKLAKEILELDAYINAEIANIDKIINSTQDFFKPEDIGKPFDIKNKIRDFTKTLIYNAADKWSWDSPEVSNRSLSKLTNILEIKNFNADRNIFVNHLNELDNTAKSKMTLLFVKIYNYIQKNEKNPANFVYTSTKKGVQSLTPLTQMQFDKFKPMATTFCYEVFINFGGNISGTEITPAKINEYCDAIINANELLLLWDDVLKDENAGKTLTTKDKGQNHLSERVLVAQMNDTGRRLDTAVESFNEFAPDSEPAPTSSSSRKQSKFSMSFNSVFSACNLLKHRLLSRTPGGGGSARGVFGGSKNKKIMKGGALTTCIFHHQLPVYILLFQLHKTVANENFKESNDFELVLQYYDFLTRMQMEISKQTDSQNACKIAMGIRDFFFINNVVSDGVKVKSLDPVLENLPTKMVSFSGLLTTEFCGALNEEYFKDDVEDRQKCMNDPVFTDFIASINIPGCFNTPFDLVTDNVKYEDFVNAVSQSSRDIAQQIVADREGDEVDAIKDASSGASSSSYVKDLNIVVNAQNAAATSAGGKKSRRIRKKRYHKKSKKRRQ